MIPQPYPIEVGKRYGGEYPGDRNPDVARTRLRSLIALGIRTFVDLTAPADPYNVGLPMEWDRHRAWVVNTFWKYLRNAWPRDAGLRLDHFLLSPPIAARLAAAVVDREVHRCGYASDHAPVWIELSSKPIRKRVAKRAKKPASALERPKNDEPTETPRVPAACLAVVPLPRRSRPDDCFSTGPLGFDGSITGMSKHLG